MSLRRQLLLRNISRDYLLQGPALEVLTEEEPTGKNVPITDLDATYDSLQDISCIPATVDVTHDGAYSSSEGNCVDADYKNMAIARSPIYRPEQKSPSPPNRRDTCGTFGTPYTEIEEIKEPIKKQKPIPPPLNFNIASTSHDIIEDHSTFSPILTGARHTSPNIDQDDDMVPALPMSPAAFLSTSTPAPNKDGSMNIPLCNTLADSTIFLSNPECNMCRICHEDGSKESLTSPCHCAGTMGMLHMSCLEKWLGSSNTTKCEICRFKFVVSKKPHSFIWYMREPSLLKDRYILIKDFLITLTLCLIMFVTNSLCLIFVLRLITEDKSGPAAVLIMIILGATLLFFVWIWFVVRRFVRKLHSWHEKYHTLQIKQTTPEHVPSPPSHTFKRPSIKLPRAFKRKKPKPHEIQPQTLHTSYISFSLESYQSYKAAMCNPVYPAHEPLLQDENNNEVTSLEYYSSSVMSLYEEEESTVIYYQPSEPGSTVAYFSETGKLLRETGV